MYNNRSTCSPDNNQSTVVLLLADLTEMIINNFLLVCVGMVCGWYCCHASQPCTLEHCARSWLHCSCMQIQCSCGWGSYCSCLCSPPTVWRLRWQRAPKRPACTCTPSHQYLLVRQLLTTNNRSWPPPPPLPPSHKEFSLGNAHTVPVLVYDHLCVCWSEPSAHRVLVLCSAPSTRNQKWAHWWVGCPPPLHYDILLLFLLLLLLSFWCRKSQSLTGQNTSCRKEWKMSLDSTSRMGRLSPALYCLPNPPSPLHSWSLISCHPAAGTWKSRISCNELNWGSLRETGKRDLRDSEDYTELDYDCTASVHTYPGNVSYQNNQFTHSNDQHWCYTTGFVMKCHQPNACFQYFFFVVCTVKLLLLIASYFCGFKQPQNSFNNKNLSVYNVQYINFYGLTLPWLHVLSIANPQWVSQWYTLLFYLLA